MQQISFHSHIHSRYLSHTSVGDLFKLFSSCAPSRYTTSYFTQTSSLCKPQSLSFTQPQSQLQVENKAVSSTPSHYCSSSSSYFTSSHDSFTTQLCTRTTSISCGVPSLSIAKTGSTVSVPLSPLC